MDNQNQNQCKPIQSPFMSKGEYLLKRKPQKQVKVSKNSFLISNDTLLKIKKETNSKKLIVIYLKKKEGYSLEGYNLDSINLSIKEIINILTTLIIRITKK